MLEIARDRVEPGAPLCDDAGDVGAQLAVLARGGGLDLGEPAIGLAEGLGDALAANARGGGVVEPRRGARIEAVGHHTRGEAEPAQDDAHQCAVAGGEPGDEREGEAEREPAGAPLGRERLGHAARLVGRGGVEAAAHAHTGHGEQPRAGHEHQERDRAAGGPHGQGRDDEHHRTPAQAEDADLVRTGRVARKPRLDPAGARARAAVHARLAPPSCVTPGNSRLRARTSEPDRAQAGLRAASRAPRRRQSGGTTTSLRE
ncbi:MAG: hypothetical protein ACLFTG_10525 [Alphaproteobacteria bacterium]